ncbi:MAG: outer membrane lipoprotein-sorting protein [Candidatus Solibacter usitatus]|nr:outer membrane lipoprotein-sorting protein [Candidatus Solibacter usitatus]
MNRLAFTLLCALPALAQDARQIVDEAQKRSRAGSQRYEGTLEVIDARRKVSTKRWVYERLGAAGESKAVLRFTAPAEVKGVALLIHNHPDRASDQWMWTPAVARERRIALQDRRTRFFGTDFTFEDLEERDVDRASYKLLGEENHLGALCWKIQSTPRVDARSQYSRTLLWIRKDNYVLLQVEGYGAGKNEDKLIRRIRYSDIEKIQNIWTARMLEVHDLERDSRTVMKLEKLQYNLPLSPENFTLQALRRER